MTIHQNDKDAREFQSTLPAGGATNAPRFYSRLNLPFQSTLPAGGATWFSAGWRTSTPFQSTLPAGGATIGQFLREYELR